MALSPRTLTTIVAAATALAIGPARAQTPAVPPTAVATSVFTGVVINADTDRPIAGASLLLPSLDRAVRSDSLGRVRVNSLPAGKHVALLQAVGYDSLLFAIDVARNDTATSVLRLVPMEPLDTATSSASLNDMVADSMETRLSGLLAAFHQRRLTRAGRFLDSADFRTTPSRRFAETVAARIPGVGLVAEGGGKYLVSRVGWQQITGPLACYVNVILDGESRGSVDLSQFEPDEVLAVEYHTVATVPREYRDVSAGPGAKASCGTLIILRGASSVVDAAMSMFRARVLDARSDTADAKLLLTPLRAPAAQQLEKVNVEATGGLAAARLREFEDRRAMGHGKFLDSTVFGELRRRPFVDVLGSRIPGIQIARDNAGGRFIISRGGGQSMDRRPCFGNVIVDGISLGKYDLALIDPDEVLAVEYHTVATVPLKYRNTAIQLRGVGPEGSATCGTLIIWRK
ncbi:MAG: carboxypeptidase-like regulatory domain-containing protein [Gemmatimonadetes bacterium]|nr:carboxypeptidase-like regulatory domain-containing protein [Gemmatimonadota bacterium]